MSFFEDRPKLCCLRCGYEWYPKKEIVRICPYCKSKYFDSVKPPKMGRKRIYTVESRKNKEQKC